IDDSGNHDSESIVMDATSVTLVTNLGAGGIRTAGISFDQNFIISLVVKAGTPSNGRGNSVVVKDTLSRPFGSSSATLFTGGGADDVHIERVSSVLSINGQNGTDTVTFGKNGSLAGIRM